MMYLGYDAYGRRANILESLVLKLLAEILDNKREQAVKSWKPTE